MQLVDGSPVFSATDLVGFLLCPHLTNLERAVLAGLVERPFRDDAELDVVRKRGLEHERRYRDSLESAGRSVVEVLPDTSSDAADGTVQNDGDRIRAQAAATGAAIHRGEDVIYQAAFFDGRWRGYADFLLRVDRPSPLGPWSYEVADTKLAHHAKASALLQICSYAEQLERIQGCLPVRMHVALGGSARAVESFRMTDHMAYFRAVKRRFEATVLRGASPSYPPLETYPDPVEHCGVCRWFLVDRRRWHEDDHLSLVAGISRGQRTLLTGRGVGTRRALAVLPLPLPPPVERTSRPALERVREQARIQVEGEDAREVLYEVLAPERAPDGTLVPNRGLGALPEPSPGDLFFDMEGDPFAFDDGLEYLFGVIEPGSIDPSPEPEVEPDAPLTLGLFSIRRTGPETFHTRWSFSPGEEKLAFEWFIDLVMERRRLDPTLHVFHYGSYERGRMGRLATRHATREAEVDELLRADVFVDLLQAVRQGVRVATESYSIKRLEPLYRLERIVELREAGQSVVEFERYLEEGRKEQAILDVIEGYNRDDCVSTWRLRDWLEERRPEAERQHGLVLPRRRLADGSPDLAQAAERQATAELAARLTAGIPATGQEDEGQAARALLANLLDWHWREDKTDWWRFWQLVGMPEEDLATQREPLSGLRLEGQIGTAGVRPPRPVFRYRFEPQETDVDDGETVFDPVAVTAQMAQTPAGERRPFPAAAGTVEAIDKIAGTVDIKIGKDWNEQHPTSLVATNVVPPKAMKEALLRIGTWVADHGLDEPGNYRVAIELLLRRPPRTGLPEGVPLVEPGADVVTNARALGHRLDGTVLAIQGPPGSGKTYTGARMIVELLAAGKKVGICAMSHKVIGNLLDEVCAAASAEGLTVQAIQRATDAQRCSATIVAATEHNRVVDAKLLTGEVTLAAGTAWLWARPELEASVDTLFVDEAGQLSLANVIAISGAARNVVLLGDPQQLEQPLKGAHPAGAEASGLEHLLAGRETVLPDRGIFLPHTHRLHPAICEFTSEVFYEGRLRSYDGLERQSVLGGDALRGSGVRWLPVAHTGNQTDSAEEVEVVAMAVEGLVGTTWRDAAGVERALEWRDVLIVAPYNAQVAAIQRRLPRARVGTVDKFQGQQAPVSIYSMATSTAEDAPRGMEFLYSLNRLNVATSRAKALAILICSPALLLVACKTPRQMQLANAFCRFLELAEPIDPASLGTAPVPAGG